MARDCMLEFARIPAGRFLMGSHTGPDDERPVHQVELAAFECALYPVTQAQYARVSPNHRSRTAARVARTNHSGRPARDWCELGGRAGVLPMAHRRR